jgi:hypothetical protein
MHKLGTSLLLIERTLKSDEWSLIFWVKENECRAMSELSKKRVRISLKAIAQFKRACVLSSSLSERCNQVFGGQYKVKNLPKESMPHYLKQDTYMGGGG